MIVADDLKERRDFGVLRHLRELAWRQKVLVIAPIVIGAVAGALLFETATKQYVATAVVVLDVRKVTVAPLEMVVSRLPQDNPAIKTEIDVLSSRSMAENVIQRIGVENLAPLLPPPAGSGSDDHYRQALVDGLTGGLQINNDGRSFTINISYTASDPVFAALIANAYAEQYFVHQTTVKLNAVRTASEWLGKKVEELRRKLETSERAVDKLSAKNLNELQREVAANRSLYESFLTRYKSTIEQEDLAGPEAQLVSEARPPGRTSTPKLMPLMALGIFLGAATGLCAAFLREHLDDRVWSPGTLEERCGIPVLGALPLPHSKRVRWPSWTPFWIRRWQRHPNSPASRGYNPALQKLQAALRFSPGTRDARVVAITSPSQGDGKTFVSIALARAISAAGSSVLIVAADLHRPALGERMQVDTACSWEDIIARKISIEDIVQKDPELNVSLINATCLHMAPLTIFTSVAFENLIADSSNALRPNSH